MIRGILLVLTLFLSSVAIGGAGATGATPTNGVLFGAFPGASSISSVQKLEGQLGKKLPLIRDFERWNDNLDNSYHRWVLDGDRTLMLSVKPVRSNGQKVTWRQIANAQPGSKIHNEMVALAKGAKSLGKRGEVWMAFHHEPEASTRTSFGDDDDFIAAWRKFHTIFKQQGANVEWVWTMTSWSYEVKSSDRRSAGKWYPGDAYVDYLGADPYNWSQCRKANEGNVSLERVIRPFMDFGKKHPSKPLVLAEFGSHENGSKGPWLDDVRSFMKKSDNAKKFAAIIYFNDSDPDAPRCKWRLDSSSSSLNAAKRIVADPFFRSGGGGAAPAPTPTPTPTPTPAGGCVVEAIDGSDRVTWPSQGSRFSYNVRRNNKWLKDNDRNTVYWNRNVTSGSYQIVARHNGVTRRLNCTRKGAAAAPAPTPEPQGLTPIAAIGGCRVDRMEGSDRVTWPNQGSGFSYKVSHNGKQIATTSNTWHWNRNVQSGNYVVKAIKNNKVATLNCRRR